MRILCYGDSNTWGYYPEDCMRLVNRWTKVTERLLPDDEIIEEGLNSRNLCNDDPVWPGLNGIKDLPMIIRSHRPVDIAVVMLGTNDLRTAYGMDAEKIADAYEDVIAIVRDEELNSPYEVPELLMVSPVEMKEEISSTSPWADEFGEDSYRTSKELAGALEELCGRYDVHFFNAADVAEACPEDSLHMDEESHIRLGEALAEVLEDIKKKMR